MRRVSIGVQDFDAAVQAAIGREQSFEATKAAVDAFRGKGVRSINIDLMYGLPHQSGESVDRTLGRVLELEPDRIATFGYAHLPDRMPHQRLIPEKVLPRSLERYAQASRMARGLSAKGYVRIGLDHFAKPADALAQGRVGRNFQGYTTDQADALLGFGASAISRLPQGYLQNAAAVTDYMRRIRDYGLATARGVELTPEDRARACIIERLMCDLAFSATDIRRRFGAVADPVLVEAKALIEADEEGLLETTADGFVVTERGRPFIRSICARSMPTLDGERRATRRAYKRGRHWRRDWLKGRAGAELATSVPAMLSGVFKQLRYAKQQQHHAADHFHRRQHAGDITGRDDIAVADRADRDDRKMHRLRKADGLRNVADEEMRFAGKLGNDAVERCKDDDQKRVGRQEREGRDRQPSHAHDELFEQQARIDQKDGHVSADGQHNERDHQHGRKEGQIGIHGRFRQPGQNEHRGTDQRDRNEPKQRLVQSSLAADGRPVNDSPYFSAAQRAADEEGQQREAETDPQHRRPDASEYLLGEEGEDGGVDGDQIGQGEREEQPFREEPADRCRCETGRDDDGKEQSVRTAGNGNGDQSH